MLRLHWNAGGHGSKFWSNLVVTKSDGRGDCVGLGGFEPGHGDAYYNNTCALPGMSGESGKVGGVPCDPQQVDMHGARTCFGS